MKISFDPPKRAKTFVERGLDFAEAGLVFAGEVATVQDVRDGYGEDRYLTAGLLRDRLVVLAWTPRDGGRHIISMRHCHAKEAAVWYRRMDRPR